MSLQSWGDKESAGAGEQEFNYAVKLLDDFEECFYVLLFYFKHTKNMNLPMDNQTMWWCIGLKKPMETANIPEFQL